MGYQNANLPGKTRGGSHVTITHQILGSIIPVICVINLSESDKR